MKKLFSLFALTLMLSFAMSQNLVAQDTSNSKPTDEEQVVAVGEQSASNTVQGETFVQEKKSFHYVLKEEFIDGGPGFMAIILICMIMGLALAIERVIYLTLSTTNSKKLLEKIESALKNGDVNAAKEICKNVPGPLAGVFWEGLDKYDDGIEAVEKAIVSYGSVATARLETGLPWIGLFIALAPMLGFMGTVVGMVIAFNQISVVGEMSPAVVAGGMKVALITTVFGLIVAVILQIFYNYMLTKIESIVVDMEDSSISFLNMIEGSKKQLR